MRYIELKKNLKKDFHGFKKIKIALLGDSSTQFLKEAIRGYGYELGFDLEIYEAEYNQIEQQVFNPSSAFYGFDANLTILFKSTQKLLKAFDRQDTNSKMNFATSSLNNLSEIVDAINNNKPKSKIILFNFTEVDDGVFGNFSNKTASSFLYQLRKLNYLLMDLSQQAKNLFICDVSNLQNQLGREMVVDPRLYIEADMVFSLDFLPSLAKNIVDILLALQGSFKKCLILDLDNTLWGGVIGDDGIDNIQIGDLGIGKAFTELQRWAKQLKRRGILLAICSKNNELTAKLPFEKHPDMELSLDDISIFIANWESKVDNIAQIKSFLNIGYDSMVFLDDNPFERNLIRTHLPEVCVPELPDDPVEYLPFLRTLNLFETISFTEEDENRTTHLQQEARRLDAKKSFTSEDDFLKSLKMTCIVEGLSAFNMPRIAQLTQRSNQFNLRTVRYTEDELKRIANNDNYVILAFSLRDKYGEHGLVSLVILEKKTDHLFIDTWIMSCRVLRRGLDNLVLNTLLTEVESFGCTRLIGEYIPTPKNDLVRLHYSQLGFSDIGQGKWSLYLDNFAQKKHFINQ